MSLVWSVAAGLLGGFAGAAAMSIVHTTASVISPQPAAGSEEPRPDAAMPKDEDATVKVASAVSKLVGRPLTDNEKPLAGTVVHYAFGAGVGAVYGAVAAFAPIVTAGIGLPFGAAVWLGAHVITVPALGLAPPPTQMPLEKEAWEFGLHLVYGTTTELLRRLLLLLARG